MWEWVSRSRIFDSSSINSSWNRDFHHNSAYIYGLSEWASVMILPWMGLKVPGNDLGSSIGIVFVVLGRRTLDGKPGGFPAGRELGSQQRCQETALSPLDRQQFYLDMP